MREKYHTVMIQAKAQTEEKKSRFIAFCQPLASESEANGFVSRVRQDYPDASHHVYAWILGGDLNLQRYSDDGEPQGTAGLPVLDVLRKNGIDQAGIVVVRYFGGTLLGTGGLARAYARAAALALEGARPVQMQLCQTFSLTVGYAQKERLQRRLEQAGCQLTGSSYGQAVELQVAVPLALAGELNQICADATGGTVCPEPAGLIYRPLPPPDPPPA